MTRPAVRVKRFATYRGSDREAFKSPRVGSGRVGSDQEVFKCHGSGQVILTPTRPARSGLETRETS